MPQHKSLRPVDVVVALWPPLAPEEGYEGLGQGSCRYIPGRVTTT